jgi:hypothetical protein
VSDFGGCDAGQQGRAERGLRKLAEHRAARPSYAAKAGCPVFQSVVIHHWPPSFRGALLREPGIHNHRREYGFRACANGRIHDAQLRIGNDEE